MKESEKVKNLEEKLIDMCGAELGNKIIKLSNQLAKIDILEDEIEKLKRDVSKIKEKK